jgi:creatinine amidohydrolase
MRAYTETGVIGFPSKASAEKGAMFLNALAEETAKTVKEFVEIG